MEHLRARLQTLLLGVENEADYFFTICLIGSWLIVGLVVSVFGFFGGLYFPLFGLLIFPLYFLFFELRALLLQGWRTKRWLVLAIIFVLGIHFVGVLVPETGFDAVWYHLPVLDYFREVGGIAYQQNLYQTANPLLSDLLFYPGFQVFGELGAKLTAYVLGLSLVVVAYRLARKILNVTWSLIFIVTILVIQPVAWQFSSFYVDVAKAFWELSLVWLLLEYKDAKRTLYGVGLLLGASLATKAFSILLLPSVIVMILLTLKKERAQKLFLFLMGVLTVATPFYLYIWFNTGSPFTSILLHIEKLQEIGGNSNLVSHIMQRVSVLPLSWWQLLTARDYISILIPMLLPVVFIFTPRLLQRKPILYLQLLVFTITQWMIWWLVPPTSTRYALSGFMVLLLLVFWATQELCRYRKELRTSIYTAIAIATVWHLIPRLVVASRSMEFILEKQTRQQYIRQFYDGSIDSHLIEWQKQR